MSLSQLVETLHAGVGVQTSDTPLIQFKGEILAISYLTKKKELRLGKQQ
jgi:hypothetical protein